MICQHCGVNEAYDVPIPDNEATRHFGNAGQYWCPKCVHDGTRKYNGLARRLNGNLAHLENTANSVVGKKWWQKKGRWVPWLVFLFIVLATLAGGIRAVFWWFFLVPFFIWIWHWGVDRASRAASYERHYHKPY